MKKANYLIGAAAMILASCANDELVRPVEPSPQSKETPMSFATHRTNQSRGEVGLETEMYDFGVWAIKVNKGDAADVDAALKGLTLNLGDADNLASNVVMDNYKVAYTAGATPDWNYVMDTPKQYLKYWDGAYTNTYFFAYGPYGTNVAFSNGSDTENPSLTFPEFTIAPGTATNYIYANVAKETNADHIKAGSPTVNIHFTHVLSKVRITLKEDIPGYTIQMASLDMVAGTGTGTEGAAVTDKGIAAIPADYDGTKTDKWSRGSYVSKGSAKVEFYGTDFANSTLSFAPLTTAKDNLYFDLPTDDILDLNTNASGTPTASATVYNVIPRSSGNSGLQFVMNYTLKSIDTNETITVKGARVYVPATYTKWAANTVYTYNFRITTNSTGTTAGDATVTNDPEDPNPQALYPIIFEDVKIAQMDDNESEWIVNGISLNKTAISIAVGENETITAIVSTPDTVTWTSDNDAVATVEDGVVTGVAAGTAKITASITTADGKTYTATCVVTVS